MASYGENNSPLQGYQEEGDGERRRRRRQLCRETSESGALLASAPCVENAGPSTPRTVDAPSRDYQQASSSSAAAQPPRRQMIKLSGERFPAILESSKYGKHPTLRYPIPGQPLCYTFEYQRTTTQGNMVYRCRMQEESENNKHSGRKRALPRGELCFACSCVHTLENVQDRVTRMVYQACQDIPKDARYAHMRAKQVYQNRAQQVDNSEVADPAERDDMLHSFCRDG
nr:unnamed protein product [Haemonchus contortus]